jgi:hypothetical protein
MALVCHEYVLIESYLLTTLHIRILSLSKPVYNQENLLRIGMTGHGGLKIACAYLTR